ncbi:MAG: hypothetical protein AMXMBFR64_41840 [Myxococcales bacterium]
MRLLLPLALALLPMTALSQTLLQDPLDGSTSGQQDGGAFVPGGWQAPHQVVWDLGATVVAGGMTVTVTNWNPNEDSPQHVHDKQHIINLYEAPHGSPHKSDDDAPKTSFINVRTGASYDNCFKILSSTGGFAERIETRVKKPYGTFTAEGTYTIGLAWTLAGDVTVSIDGVPQETHHHGKPLALRHVFIGTDNAPSGTYGPQNGVIYRDVHVWGETGEPGPVEPPPPPPGFIAPDADTWAEPLNPTATHGSDTELRTGGDGRTIYLRFTVSGVGPVKSALLRLTAMNGGFGGEIHRVGDTAWSEATLSYANRPALDPVVLDALGLVDIGETYILDVSGAVKQDGVYSFAITSSEADGSGYHSRETGPMGPLLEVTAGEPSPEGPPPIPDTCDGACGGTALSGCQCFAPCLEQGTCCKDACAVCGVCPTTEQDAGPRVSDAGGSGGADDAGGGTGGRADAGAGPSATDDAGSTGAPGGQGGALDAPAGSGFSVDAGPGSVTTTETNGCQTSAGGGAGGALALLGVWLLSGRRRVARAAR